jgi:hypothetical protein
MGFNSGLKGLKYFLAVNGTGAGHEDYNPARYMIMTTIFSCQM